MNFEDAASTIICQSITNAICIDNDFLEPYSKIDDPSHPRYVIPKGLYDSFKKNNCLLDVYTYEDFSKWMEMKESIFKNKDLLILDWELTDGDPPFRDTLEILYHAIIEEGMQFVYLYTHELDLSKLIINIHSYFNKFSKEEIKKIHSDIISELEDIDEIDDAEKILEDIGNISKESLVNPVKRESLRGDIHRYFTEELDTDDPEAVIQNIIEIFQKYFQTSNKYEMLYTICLIIENGFFQIEGDNHHFNISPIENDNFAFIINNTLVKLSTKKLETTEEVKDNVVSSDQIYSEISKTVWRRPRNFLVLMGLEIRNLYRNGSTRIGKDLCEIDELAFFQHQQSLDEIEIEGFNEFLKQLWMDEISSFLLDGKPIIFSALQDYKKIFDIEDSLTKVDKEVLINSIAKLNHYYSIIRRKQKSRNINFGDIFHIIKVENNNGKQNKKENGKDDSFIEYQYLMCITPACDCLRPDKIDNEFYFVQGKQINLKKGLEISETDYISFIVIDENPIAIQWKTKPFTIYIRKEQNNIDNDFICNFSSMELYFKFICQQKENYSQRIANQSFSEASRIGVAFAKLD